MLEASHTKTLSYSTLTSFSRAAKSSLSVHKKVSSANSFTNNLVASGKSLIKIRKRRGLKIEPWGTPKSIVIQEDVTLFTLTYCDLELR